MPRTLLAIALCGLAVPLLAAGQTATTKAHPAASSHATAVAGQADAARIEACTAAANSLIDNLEKGDYKAATADFDSTMRANLDADKLGDVWQNVAAHAGKLEGRGTVQNVMYQGHTIITLPLRFRKIGLNARVACDPDGKIAGFFLRPAKPAAAD